MKYTWIKNNNNRLLVFFNGWGCDEHQFDHLQSNTCDILFFNDYKELTLSRELIDHLKSYQEINIIAWSYGVWVAQAIWEKYLLPKNKAIAINGTTSPVHDKYGIPESIVQGTLDHLSERNLMKFQRRMLGGSAGWKQFEAHKPQRTFEDQKEELAALIKHFKQDVSSGDFYTKAIIGSGDLIFVATNQKEFWQNKAVMEEWDTPHFCFFDVENWDNILT